ncbi:hypothetical protein HK096_000765, partial [Nowakowskiella sp. JEL0078]
MGFSGNATSSEGEAFVRHLNPALNHKVICAIDFGTSGTGYAYAFTKPFGEIDPRSEVFPNSPWPLDNSLGKTSTSIVFQNGNIKEFGTKATNFMATKVKASQRSEYQYFHNFKMQLFTEKTLNSHTLLRDETTGKTMTAVKVIGECLSHVKKAFVSQITLASHQITPSDVLWVVTVPAIWKDGAKKVMREAACLGGLINSMNSESLMLVLEPEAASMWCLKNQHIELKSGDNYIIVDCGGGTVDVTYHEISKVGNSEQVKEVYPVSGGDWGSTAIDKRFFSLIKNIFGDEMYSELLNDSKNYLRFCEEWEKMKCSFDKEEEMSINLPRKLADKS